MNQINAPNRFVQFIENVLFEDDPQSGIEQVVVEPGKAYIVPRCIKSIDMVIGEAQVTHLGHEVLLKAGDATLVHPRQGRVIVVAQGGNPCVLNLHRQ